LLTRRPETFRQMRCAGALCGVSRLWLRHARIVQSGPHSCPTIRNPDIWKILRQSAPTIPLTWPPQSDPGRSPLTCSLTCANTDLCNRSAVADQIFSCHPDSCAIHIRNHHRRCSEAPRRSHSARVCLRASGAVAQTPAVRTRAPPRQPPRCGSANDMATAELCIQDSFARSCNATVVA